MTGNVTVKCQSCGKLKRVDVQKCINSGWPQCHKLTMLVISQPYPRSYHTPLYPDDKAIKSLTAENKRLKRAVAKLASALRATQTCAVCECLLLPFPTPHCEDGCYVDEEEIDPYLPDAHELVTKVLTAAKL